MAVGGKLEKMLILAFASAQDAEDGGLTEAKEHFEALINPETYTLEYKVKTSTSQGQGTSSAQSKFEYILPEELTFDFLFDNTGLIDGTAKPDGVFDDVDTFRKLLTGYRGDSHEPYHLKLVWGNLVFKGRAIEVGITYKLFNPDGQPIRAVVRVKFKGSVEERKRAALEFRQSPTSPTSASSCLATRCRSCVTRSTATPGTTCTWPSSTISTTSAALPSARRSCSRRSSQRWPTDD